MNTSDPPADLTCPRCSAPVRVGAWFCRNCGFEVLEHASKSVPTPIEPNTESESPQPPPADPAADPSGAAPEPQPDNPDSPSSQEIPASPNAPNNAETAPPQPWTARFGLHARLGQATQWVGQATQGVRQATKQRSKRRRLIGIAGVIVALALGCGVILPIVRAGGEPETVVRELFEALAEYDGAKASTLGSCAGSPVCEQTLLVNGLSRNYEPPYDLRIEGVDYRAEIDDPTRRPNKNEATVRMSYRLGENTYKDVAYLVRSSPADGPRKWSLASPMGRHFILTTPVPSEVRVADAKIKVSKSGPAGPTRAVWLVPGIYGVTGVSNVLYDEAPFHLTVAERDPCIARPGSGAKVSPIEGLTGVWKLPGCEGESTTIPLKIKTSTIDEINRQVKLHLDACASQTVWVPRAPVQGINRRCPFFLDQYNNSARNIKWRITKYPEVALKDATKGPATVHTTVPGSVTLTWEWPNNFIVSQATKWTPASKQFEVKVAGEVTVDSSEPSAIVFSPT